MTFPKLSMTFTDFMTFPGLKNEIVRWIFQCVFLRVWEPWAATTRVESMELNLALQCVYCLNYLSVNTKARFLCLTCHLLIKVKGVSPVIVLTVNKKAKVNCRSATKCKLQPPVWRSRRPHTHPPSTMSCRFVQHLLSMPECASWRSAHLGLKFR